MTTSPNILGHLSVASFLADYWQKQPLLIKNALPGFTSPLSGDELAGLSLESDVESRLVTGNGKKNTWTLTHGPFHERTFQSLPDHDWTLLVQGVDLWEPEVSKLIDFFDFLPRWRIDDVMVSYATDGGSVGPHFDYYDVFLLQGSGMRRWEIGGLCDEKSPLLENAPLKILADFMATESWHLESGDMLYLPPGIAHHGIAISGECMTYSVGFRSPTAVEMLNDLAVELMSRNDRTTRLKDPPIDLSVVGDNLPDAYIQALRQLLLENLDNRCLLEDWFGRFMTMPKNLAIASEDISGYSRQQLVDAVNNGAIHELVPGARAIKTGQGIYLNGEKL